MADVVGRLLGGSTFGGNAIGAAIVQLRLDSGDYQRQMAASEAQTKAAANNMGTSTSKFAGLGKAAFLGVGAAAVVGIGLAIKAGSDLNEQLNKSRVVFGDASKSVIKFSEDTASSLGLAQSEALQAAGNFGAMFDAAGLASQAAADMSIKMTTLGADLGSFNNIPVAEALEKIRGGLSGEAEPLRELGVFLSEARVEAEAFASGIAKTGTELTDAQKIQARYNLILEDTTKAQGDFARTVGESLPNQLKVFKAELTDVAADLGIALLPIVLEVVKAFKLLVPLLKFVADNLVLILAALAGFSIYRWLPRFLFGVAEGLTAIGAANLSVGLTALGHGLTAIGQGITTFGGAIATAAPLAVGFAAALTAGTAALVAWDPAGLIDDVDEMNRKFEEGTLHLGKFTSQTVAGKGELDALGNSTINYNEVAKETGRTLDAAGERGAYFHRQIDEAGRSVTSTGKIIDNFANLTERELREWSKETKESFEDFVLVLDESAESTKITRREFIDATNAMQREARQLAIAMREISKEKWVNDDYVKFLSEQGPAWLIGFANLTETQQRKAQDAWEESTRKTKLAKQSLDDITGVLDKLDKGTSKHEVVIQYRYEGFDPSKPGMAGAGASGPAPRI